MTTWLLKSEPDTYSWDDLVRDRTTVWDGVANNTALIHLRAMQPGDEVLFYHSGGVRAIIGLAKITKGAYPDPKLNDPKRVVVEIGIVKPLAEPVTLAQVKAVPALQQMALVRISRLSCQPVTAAERQVLTELGVV